MTIKTSVTTLMWDLDGTIMDSLAIMENVLASILPRYGYEMPAHETMIRNLHGTIPEIIDNGLGGVDPVELAAIHKDFLHAQHEYYQCAGHHLFDDALRLMRAAHESGKRQIIVTNRDHRGMRLGSPRAIVTNSAMAPYIDAVFCGDDSEHRKPKPELLGSYLQDNNIVPDEIVMIGDQFIDAEFGHNVGAETILIARDGAVVPHLERLSANCRAGIMFVKSFDAVVVENRTPSFQPAPSSIFAAS